MIKMLLLITELKEAGAGVGNSGRREDVGLLRF